MKTSKKVEQEFKPKISVFYIVTEQIVLTVTY